MNEEYMTVKSDDGKEHKCRILFTYYSKEFEHHYVVFQVEDTDELSAMIYEEKGDNSGTLHPIDNDEEWAMLEEVVSNYMDEQEEGCNGGCDHCHSGCGHEDCDCDHEECDCDHDGENCGCHHHHHE